MEEGRETPATWGRDASGRGQAQSAELGGRRTRVQSPSYASGRRAVAGHSVQP